MKYFSLIILLNLLLSGICLSQTIPSPNYVLKSHETLEITSIYKSEKSVIVNLKITNYLEEGGSFCVDKNTILRADGINYQLISTKNIPNCPKVHNFEFSGDILLFSLKFPPLPTEIKIIDIIENCEDNCFSIKAIVIDSSINNEMNTAFNYYESGMFSEGLSAYRNLLNKYKGNDDRLEGLFYFYIISILNETDNKKEAQLWLEKFRKSGLTECQWLEEKIGF